MKQQVEDILAKAIELGELIAECSASKAYKKTRQDVQADEQAKKLTEDYQQQIQKIAELEQNAKPIEPEDKKKLADIQQQVASHSTLKAWMKAQMDISDLMRKVNQAISKPFQGESDTESESSG